MVHALFLNCTLKYDDTESNTKALIEKAQGLMEDRGASTAYEHVLSYDIGFGVTSEQVHDGDEWPELLEQITAADILVIGSPIWFGVRSSVAQLVIERLDGTYEDGDPETGQYPLYNTVGACIVTGNEDGAHDVAANTLFNLSHLGCTIPPNADCYWVGDAGPGASYIEADGDKHLYTNRTARLLAENTIAMAEQLRENPLKTNLNEIEEEARQVSE